MSKFEETLTKYEGEMKKLGVKYDAELLRKVTKACGPSIYNRDASTVSTSDETELNTVRNNFCIKKLGLKDGPEIDKAFGKIKDTFGASNKNKYRAIFYYLLTKEFNKESVFN